MKRTIAWIPTIIGGVLLLAAGIVLVSLEARLPKGEGIEILESGGDLLAGTYYPGERDRGVILTEGFGSDQAALRSLVAAFAEQDYHILTFDFSGHGRSPGGLGFDNAETNRLALQILDAKKLFKKRADLDDDEILIAGHSLGARAALQAAALDETPPTGLILIGTQVNLVTNVQAEVFTGVSDVDLEWVQALGPGNPGSNVLLISGEWDDILTPEAARLLMEKLAGASIASGGEIGSPTERSWRKLIVVPGVLHNYEIYAERVIREVISGADFVFGTDSKDLQSAGGAAYRYLAWLSGITGLFLFVIGISTLIPGEVLGGQSTGLTLTKPGRYFLGKTLFWVPALIPAALLGGLIFLLPLGNPAFNLIYISFLGGYGILVLLIYNKNWMPGVQGRLKPDFGGIRLKGFITTSAAFLAILLVTALFARSGWFFVLPVNQRLIWALIFAPITALGFWIGWQENQMLANAADKPAVLLVGNTLVGLLPFFLYAGFLAAIGSLSGVIGAVQGLLILFLAISSGVLFQKLGKSTLLTSIYQSFLIYWLILAQGVLFL